jgi:hypothetical protein
MIDVHPPHESVHTWKDFFIHIATIVIGLIIAVGLEQTVEFFHHRHSAADARASIQEETSDNLEVLHYNLQSLARGSQQLETGLGALNSNATDADVLTHLQYKWELHSERDTAWQAAKIDGSLALIPRAQLSAANYFYGSNDNLTPTIFAYFADIDTAAAIVDHARATGTLTASERQQLLSRTMSALGYTRLLTGLYEFRARAAEKVHLQ